MNLQVMRLIAIIVVVLLVGSLSSNVVLATNDGNSGLVSILNQSKEAAQERMMQLQDAGINATAEVQSQYSQGLVEYQSAIDYLTNDTSSGRTHAFHAMELFKSVIEASQQHLVNSESNDTNMLLQNIVDSQAYAQKIRVIAMANGISADFSDYDKAISMANAFAASNNLSYANEQLLVAQGLLDKIYFQIEQQAESTKQERTTQFLKDTQVTLTQMIDNAKSLGLPQSTIDNLQATLDKLYNAKTVEDVINTTNQSSTLQNVTDQYNGQRIVNFQKESVRISHEIDVLHESASKINVEFSGFNPINQLLDDIKQKITQGQVDEASQELDEVDSLLTNMNDVVNGAPAIIQQIADTKTFADSLRNQAQGNENALNNIEQNVQMLDSAYSLIVNATSASDLQSSKETISQATGALNDIKDSLNSNPPENTTANTTQVNATTTNTTPAENSTNDSNSNSTQNSNQTSNSQTGENATNSTGQ